MNEKATDIDAVDSQSTMDSDAPAAWQMIEPGRYQPRRIKGSCVGRELG